MNQTRARALPRPSRGASLWPRALAALLALPALPALAAQAGAPVFWVGPAAPCNFNSIQTAILAVPDGAVVRIASNQAYDDINLTIANKSLTLEGGWADCTGTVLDGRVLLQGDPDLLQPVIRISAGAPGREVTLTRLQLRGGRSSGLAVSGPVDVEVRRSWIDGNQGQVGGGLRINGSGPAATEVSLVETLVGNAGVAPLTGNQAINGGGLACIDASLRLRGAQVRNNQAEMFGGGLYLDNCAVSTGLNVFSTPGYGPFNARIDDNRALGFGGGLYALGGSRITLGPPGGTIAIAGNRAVRGGGVYLGGGETRMLAVGLQLEANSADDFGGGGYLDTGALLLMQREFPAVLPLPEGRGAIPVAGPCDPPVACSLVRGNQADGFNGNAFHLNGATLELRHTQLSDNGAGGRSLILASNVSDVLLESSLVTGNDSGGSDLFRLIDGSEFDLRASTITDNTSGTILRSFTPGGDNYIDVVASIIWQPGTRVYWPDVADTTTTACLNAHDAADLPAALHVPGFIDAAAGDFRLRGDSANVDACVDPFGVPAVDLFGTARPFELDHLAGPGPADRGALELGDAIFEHDFEPTNLLEAAPAVSFDRP
jgi:hypothetical protein